ncbi:MAG: hypothetical protein WBF06_11270 [Candidatus Acidiferrales bacterium]
MYSRLAAGACALALIAFGVSGHSQAPATAPADPPPMHGNMAHFVGFEGNVGGRTVTGAPYSADVTTEFTRTLSDGTVIDRKTTSMFARDGMGRTRREITMSAIGPFATSGAPRTIISIDDPVAHKRYVLNPADKTARELGGGPRMGGFGGGRDGGHSGGQDSDGGRGGMGGGHDGGHDGMSGGGRGGMHGGDGGTTVSLGTKTIEGVTVEGTRTTQTIPAGAMGNQQPIMITFERWYSPDLLTNVMTVRSNPFEGKTTFMLTNLKRGEPDASLFTVPSDYKMAAMGAPGHGHMGGGPGGPDGKGNWSGHHMHGGPGAGGNSGGGPNPNPAPMPPAAPGQGQDD